LLCYLIGKSRFVGVLEALSESYWDESPIWASDPFPVRSKTRLVLRVAEDDGLHLHDVAAHSDYAKSWSGYYRGSSQRLPENDGEFIVHRLRELAETEAERPTAPPVQLQVGEDEPELRRSRRRLDSLPCARSAATNASSTAS
jgi:hypothetical protein